MRKAFGWIFLSLMVQFPFFYAGAVCDVGTEPYKQLEYIEFSGTQYLDMDFKANTTTTKYETKIVPTKISGTQGIFGSRNTVDKAGDSSCNIFIYQEGVRLDWAMGNGGSDSMISAVANKSYVISITRGKATVNGKSYKYSNKQSVDQDNSFLIGNFTNGSFSAYPTGFNGKVYYAKLYDNDILVRNLFPVRRNKDGKIGMFDRVNGVFYENSGTGEFIAGPIIGELEDACSVCRDGYYNDVGNNTSCVQCPAGYNASRGDNASDHDNINDCKTTCAPGYYVATPNAQCVGVGNGYYYPSNQNINYGSVGIRNQCPDGLNTIGFGAGADEVGDCGMKLHVVDDALYLRSERKTSPALNVEYGGRVFYGNMDPYTIPMSVDTTRKLHVEYNNTVYSVHDDSTDFDGMGYLFSSDGRLIGTSENVYLESTGTQWIDSGYVPNRNFGFDAVLYVAGNSPIPIFGQRSVKSTSTIEDTTCLFDVGLDLFGGGRNKDGDNALLKHNYLYKVSLENQMFSRYNYKTQSSLKKKVTYGSGTIGYGNIYVFSVNDGGIPNERISDGLKIYQLSFYDGDNLVRDFVPVPAGMVINGYMVPSNSMWDIVEQKFYGNSGTGEFIYGVD